METNHQNTEDPTWELPKFYFEVDFGNQITGIRFEESLGLDFEEQITEYRDEFHPLSSTINMPGIIKSGNVTLKRGLFKNDTNFKNWVKKLKMNTIERRTISIKLIIEAENINTEWRLISAYPVKMTNTNLQTDANEVLVDTLEIKHEGLVIVNNAT